MAKSNKSNPLKTFNDNHDKRVKSFDKTLKKFQGNISGSQVSKNSLEKLFGPKRVEYDFPMDKLRESMKEKYRKEMMDYMTGLDSINRRQFKRPSPVLLDSTTIKKKGGAVKSKKK